MVKAVVVVRNEQFKVDRHTQAVVVSTARLLCICFHPRPPLGLLSLPVCRRVQGADGRWLFFCILADSGEYKWLYHVCKFGALKYGPGLGKR
jgi:hypothetical protein